MVPLPIKAMEEEDKVMEPTISNVVASFFIAIPKNSVSSLNPKFMSPQTAFL